MEVRFSLTSADLQAALTAVAPFRYPLSEDGTRFVEVSDVRDIRLVEGEGIRLVASGCVQWTVATLPLTVQIHSAELQMTPSIQEQETGVGIDFAVRLGRIDLEHTPELVEDAIAKRINAALAEPKNAIAWAYERSLAVSIPIVQLQPTLTFGLEAARGTINTTAASLDLTIPLSASFSR